MPRPPRVEGATTRPYAYGRLTDAEAAFYLQHGRTVAEGIRAVAAGASPAAPTTAAAPEPAPAPQEKRKPRKRTAKPTDPPTDLMKNLRESLQTGKRKWQVLDATGNPDGEPLDKMYAMLRARDIGGTIKEAS